jgi:hypothetical protein
VALVIACSTLAQYKKASFFTRNGKFYGVNAGMYMFGKGVSAAPVIGFVYGKDKGEKRIWHWWDLEVLLPSKFSYNTVDINNNNIKLAVAGKTNTILNWRYNWCYYFADNTKEEVKGLPFTKIALQISVAGERTDRGLAIVSPASFNPQMNPYYGSGAVGGDLGGGYAYRISETATLFGCAGYRILIGVDANVADFNLAPNGAYANIAVRFARKKND